MAKTLTVTFRQQFDKITEAYIKGEIKPYNAEFCFCGTLCGNSRGWQISRNIEHRDYAGYEGIDFVRMENALLDTIEKECGGSMQFIMSGNIPEDALFNGMCSALEVLKQIHISKGENVDDDFLFTKRVLVNV